MVSLQTVLPQLHQLQETIRGKKCEVHVASLLRKYPTTAIMAIQQCSAQYTQCIQYFLHAEAQQLEDKMADLSLASKVQHTKFNVP